MSNITHPHDAIFKLFLRDLAVAEDFLKVHMPARYQQHMDFSTLKLEPASYVDKALKQYCSDILYSIKNKQGGDCYIYALIEHQSTPDALMAFRLLRYSLAVMQQHIDKNKNATELPFVVPIMFYHGATSPYQYSMDFLDCFANKTLAQAIYHRPFHLVDVTIIPDDEILTHRNVALLEIVQKHIRRRDLLEIVDLLVKAVQASQPNHELFKSLLCYISVVGEASDEHALLDGIAQAVPQYREDVMTIAQQLEQRGEQRGMQQGMQQGIQQEKHQVAKNLFAAGVDHKVIKQSTGLSDDELAKLH